MKPTNLLGYLLPNSIKTLFPLFAITGATFCSISIASSQVTVTDDGFSLSPDPVTIQVGDTVVWVDDGTGPYSIISDIGAWQTFQTPGGIIFSQPGTYTYHDDAGDFGTIQVNVNMAPVITITNPAPGAVLSQPATFAFGVDTFDPDSDGLAGVEFYVGANLVDQVFSDPFTTTVSNLSAGIYTLTAIAFDNAGDSATNSITITVGLPASLTLSSLGVAAGQFQFNASGLIAGKTNVLFTTTDLQIPISNWTPVATNVASNATMTFSRARGSSGFFRLVQLP